MDLAPEPAPALHTCKSCAHTFAGNYCNSCGEKVQAAHDRSFLHLAEEAFHFLTHFEGKFLNTLRAVLTAPGRLSADYVGGIRKAYFKPLSFFLMLVILYLLFPVYEGLNMQLRFHLSQGFYGDYASQLVSQLQETRGLTFQELSERFHYKGEKISKFLLFVNIPLIALVSFGLGFRKRAYYYDHFIFSTECVSFFLLWGFLLLPLISFVLAAAGWRILDSDWAIGVVMLGGFFVFLLLAAHRFFRFPYWYSLVYAVVFSLLLAFFVQFVYKFLLFIIVVHLI